MGSVIVVIIDNSQNRSHAAFRVNLNAKSAGTRSARSGIETSQYPDANYNYSHAGDAGFALPAR